MSEHIVKSYSVELDTLAAEISHMGGMAEKQLSSVIDAISRRDIELAEKVRVDDKLLDKFYRKIEDDVMRILALRQPVAVDLRQTVAALQIAHELERVGDLAKNIAKRGRVLSTQDPLKAMNGVVRMGRISLSRLSDVLNAYSQSNIEGALSVWSADEEIDELYNNLFQEILLSMMGEPASINECTQLVFVAKNLERIGDHATNIAEIVHYSISGEYIDEKRPKGDTTSTTVIKEK